MFETGVVRDIERLSQTRSGGIKGINFRFSIL